MRQSLRIIQCLRAPVGGLFRHVLDLTRAQAEQGHAVGIICDASTGGELADSALAAIAPFAKLGIRRVAMSRDVGLADAGAYRATLKFARDTGADVLHGHGAKGGAYARLACAAARRRGSRIAAFYTPHGGSLHYDRASLKGRAFLGLEQLLVGVTDGLIFESDYSYRAFEAKVGSTRGRARVIHNGLSPAEFDEVTPDADAADFLFVGELRQLKGVDLMIDAVAAIGASAVIVGAGPDEDEFKQRAAALSLAEPAVTFTGARPARQMFAKGRCLVVPSRAESFPYIVLEAAAAGVPMIVTDVGGIPEIYGGLADRLIAANDGQALATAMRRFLAAPDPSKATAASLRASLQQRFTVERMASAILAAYADGRAAINLKPARTAAAQPDMPRAGMDHA